MKLSADHLPGTARDLIDLVGLPTALTVIEIFGGQTLSIAKGARARGRAQLDDLAERIGSDAAKKIARRYAGGYLCVPNCKRAMLAVRDAELQARFDAAMAEGRTARATVAVLAREYHLVESSIWRALTRVADGDVVGASADSPQADLFAAPAGA